MAMHMATTWAMALSLPADTATYLSWAGLPSYSTYIALVGAGVFISGINLFISNILPIHLF